MERSLLIGCGNNYTKQLIYEGKSEWTGELTKLDINPNCGADVLFDMSDVAERGGTMPFDDDSFDEMGAFNTLEHWGRQGDSRGYFHEFGEYWRILKPGGLFSILVPINGDALADPGHTRFFSFNHFGFLSQVFYERNEVKSTCFTDYRWLWKKNFDVLFLQAYEGHHIAAVLRKA